MGERRDSPMTLNGLTRREFLKVAGLASASVLGIAGCGGSSGGVGAKGMEEAAMVDGATRFQTFWRVALPLTAPGIVTTAILCLVFSWSDYAFAVTFTGPGSQTLPVAASQLITQTGVNWGQLTAIGTVVALPMVVVGLAVRRYLVRGLPSAQ